MNNTTERQQTAVLPENSAMEPEIAHDIKKFERDGFIGPIKLYEESEANDIMRRLRAKNHDRRHILYDNKMNYDRHFDIPELTEHLTHPLIVKYLRAILGTDILLWRSEWFAKFPGTSGTEWHQVRDYSYTDGNPLIVPTESGWNAYIDLTVWTAFTPATRETSCMRFIPGSHKKFYYDERKETSAGRVGLYDHTKTDSGFFGYNFEDFKIDPDWDPEKSGPIDMEMRPGEAVIFTASCVHGSTPNRTERETRLAISGRYVPTHVRVYPGLDKYKAHGEEFDLTQYATVLVSGEDHYEHNKIRAENNHGQKFRRYGA